MLIEIQLKAQEKCQIVFHIHVDGIFQGNDLEQGGIPVVRISYCIVEGEQSFPVIEKHAKQGILVIAPGPDGSETAPSCLLLFHFLFTHRTSFRRRPLSAQKHVHLLKPENLLLLYDSGKSIDFLMF